MFDLIQRADAQSVPVPLPGRVIYFAGGDGAMLARLPDGSVISMKGAPGLDAFQRRAVGAAVTVGNSAALVDCVSLDCSADLVGAQSAILIVARGVQSSSSASTLQIHGVIGGQSAAVASQAMGNTARVNRGWSVEARLHFMGAGAFAASIAFSVDGLAPVYAGSSVLYPVGGAFSLQLGWAAAVSGAAATCVQAWAIQEMR